MKQAVVINNSAPTNPRDFGAGQIITFCDELPLGSNDVLVQSHREVVVESAKLNLPNKISIYYYNRGADFRLTTQPIPGWNLEFIGVIVGDDPEDVLRTEIERLETFMSGDAKLILVYEIPYNGFRLDEMPIDEVEIWDSYDEILVEHPDLDEIVIDGDTHKAWQYFEGATDPSNPNLEQYLREVELHGVIAVEFSQTPSQTAFWVSSPAFYPNFIVVDLNYWDGLKYRVHRTKFTISGEPNVYHMAEIGATIRRNAARIYRVLETQKEIVREVNLA